MAKKKGVKHHTKTYLKRLFYGKRTSKRQEKILKERLLSVNESGKKYELMRSKDGMYVLISESEMIFNEDGDVGVLVRIGGAPVETEEIESEFWTYELG